MKKKIIITIVLIILVIICVILVIRDINNQTISLGEDKQELMDILGIKDAPSFLPISIKTVDLGIGDTSECYIFKFEISIEDYNKNSLNYNDIDTTEISLNWKEKKDEETYICYVREWEYNDNRKELFNELKKLKNKY